MNPPSSQEHWLEISGNFYKETNFPNSAGVEDGKHIRLFSPQINGSNISITILLYYWLLFIPVDIGSYGREGDSSSFNQWNFGRKLFECHLNLPAPRALPNFTIITLSCFPLNLDFLRPYPISNLNNTRRIFNYRLSRARRHVECAFGILSNKWRVFHTSIISPNFAVKVTKAVQGTGINLKNHGKHPNVFDHKPPLFNNNKRYVPRTGTEVRKTFGKRRGRKSQTLSDYFENFAFPQQFTIY